MIKMKEWCTICNESFILTYDWDAIDNAHNLEKSKDCLWCSDLQKRICKDLLSVLNKNKPKDKEEIEGEKKVKKIRNKRRWKNKWKEVI